jgi:hypothetical protein
MNTVKVTRGTICIFIFMHESGEGGIFNLTLRTINFINCLMVGNFNKNPNYEEDKKHFP